MTFVKYNEKKKETDVFLLAQDQLLTRKNAYIMSGKRKERHITKKNR